MGILGLPLPLLAQGPTPQDRIDAAAVALGELDGRAEACRNSLEAASDEEALQRCSAFLEAIDGEVLAGYLSHCEALKAWREQFITSPDSTTADDQAVANLQLMVGIERVCGENALQRQTHYVINTFTLLQDGQIQNRRADAALLRRLAEMRFDATVNTERRALENAIQQQQNRRLFETQRQWDDLEDELIRQQIRNPSNRFPGN